MKRQSHNAHQNEHAKKQLKNMIFMDAHVRWKRDDSAVPH
jgi:hypothetical protein